MIKKRIGVVFESIHGVYQERITSSIVEQTKDKNIDLIFFCGLGVLDITGNYEIHKGILQLANKPAVDGLILVMTSFTNYVGKEWVDELIRSYGDTPKVTISYELEGVPNVCVDNQKSMELIVNHLIEEIGCKTIGYISGPLSNVEAQDRYLGYQIALNDHEIEIDKQFFYEGFFIEKSGTKAIESLLKTNKEIPDAIVSANDEMAIGASFELLENGIRIPYDIKMTGFDNITESSSFEVPLTTINQPFDEMVKSALDILDCQLFDKTLPKNSVIVGELIVRASSKVEKNNKELVITNSDLAIINDEMIGAHINFEGEVNDNMERLKRLLYDEERCNEDLDILFSQMMKSLILDTKNDYSNGKFTNKCLQLSKLLVKKIPYNMFNNRYHQLKLMVSSLTKNSQLYNRVQEVFYLTIIAINNHFFSLENIRVRTLTDRYIMSRSFTNIIVSATTYSELQNGIIEQVLMNDISEFYITFFEEVAYDEDIKKKSDLPDKSCLFLGINNKDILNKEVFETRYLLPKYILQSQNQKKLIALELFREGHHFGHLVMRLDSDDLQIYETLRLAISIKLYDFYIKKFDISYLFQE